MSVKYQCKECSTGCEIVVPSETYEPCDCPSYSSYCDWQHVKDAPQNINETSAQPTTQVKTLAAPTPEREILRALYYACCEADAYGELSEYIDGSLLDRAKLLLT